MHKVVSSLVLNHSCPQDSGSLISLADNDPTAPTEKTENSWCSICTASMEKRIKMEQTWQRWQRFLHSYSRYEDWLRVAEQKAEFPNSSQVSYSKAKEELKKFEVLQREIQENLMQLESLNKHYCQLARENGIGVATRLKKMVHEGGQRWDNLQKRTATIYKRLKHFVNQHEKFESEREQIGMWLTEMDLKLTEVEHLSGSNTSEKMQQLQGFREDISINTEWIDQLLVFGEELIQKSEPQDAQVLEEEIQDLLAYCQEVFTRVDRFYRKLISMKLVFEDEWICDRDIDLGSDYLSDVFVDSEGVCTTTDPTQQCHSTPLKVPRSQHRSDTRGGSVELEWDPSVDVGGSTSHDDEDSSYYSAATGKSGVYPLEPALPSDPSNWGENSVSTFTSEVNITPMNEYITQSSSYQHLQDRKDLPKVKWLNTEETTDQTASSSQMSDLVFSFANGQYTEKSITMEMSSSGHCYHTEQKLEKKLRYLPQSDIVINIEKGQELVSANCYQKPRRFYVKDSLLQWVLRMTILGILVLVILISMATLLPPAPHNCFLLNNFAHSFHFKLQYVNGPPPT
ncbi:nesprin-2 [Latimeria chalumnae]|uniref:nesprin-2 n=1 Tax=Latimeria chalumnae TaxID=7897 RepID=UPI0003C144FC|nr:PREDICTED: nesprin-4 [Latimeria chalumnae]|eukprot:XP_005987840.1 PREDICTED: nesprin-4 [Latimeria chalumnae]